MLDGKDNKGKTATHQPHMPQPRSISSPPSGVSGIMGFWLCPATSTKGSTAGTLPCRSAGASVVGPPSLKSSSYCKRTGHFGHGTKSMEDEGRFIAARARAPTLGSNSAQCNTAAWKPAHCAKGHRVARHVVAAAVAALVATSGAASRCRSHLIDTGHHTDQRARCSNGCRNYCSSRTTHKHVVGEADSPTGPSQTAERKAKTATAGANGGNARNVWTTSKAIMRANT